MIGGFDRRTFCVQAALVPAVGLYSGLCRGDDDPAAAKQQSDKSVRRLRFTVDPIRPWFYAKIDAVDQNGAVRIVPGRRMAADAQLMEGLYLAVLHESKTPSLDRPKLLRVAVAEVGSNGSAALQVSQAVASSLKPGHRLALFRPASATTARLKEFPDVLLQADGEAPWPKTADELQLCRAQSLNNVKVLSLALALFENEHNRFPPAAIFGPDGKPWHSWRVLLLPYLDQRPLYDTYKWDEPWSGPNNRRLIEKMPAIYSDPIHGDNDEHFAHYAAITGTDMAFSPDGSRFDGKELKPDDLKGRSIREFSDSTSETLMIGPVGPDRKIPWTKPEDVVVPEKMPKLQRAGLFAFPYPTDKGNIGPFLRADGAVLLIPDQINPSSFREALTIAGAEMVDWGEIRGADLLVIGKRSPVIYIDAGEKGPSARVVLEPIPDPRPLLPPLEPATDRQGTED